MHPRCMGTALSRIGGRLVDVVPAWTGRLAVELQRAMRLTNEAFAAHLGVSTRTVAKWHETPDAEPIATTQEILDAALFAADTSIQRRFALLAEGKSKLEQLNGSASQAPLRPWELVDTLTRTNISAAALDEMEHTVEQYCISYPTSPPRILIAPVNQQMARLREALTHAQRLSVQRRCVRLVGLLAGIAGNLYVDIGMPDNARAMFRAGRHAATETDDTDLAAWLIATESIAPYFSGRWNEAASLLEGAGSFAQRASSLRRRSWIAGMHARALAAAGNESGAQRALEKAHSSIDAVVGPPTGNDFFDRPRLDGLAGSALLLLRDTSAASALLMQALKSRASQDLKGRALLTLDLASCRIIEGELDETARLATKALSIAQDAVVGPIIDRIHRLRRQFAPAANSDHLVELDARLTEVAGRDPGGD